MNFRALEKSIWALEQSWKSPGNLFLKKGTNLVLYPTGSEIWRFWHIKARGRKIAIEKIFLLHLSAHWGDLFKQNKKLCHIQLKFPLPLLLFSSANWSSMMQTQVEIMIRSYKLLGFVRFFEGLSEELIFISLSKFL